MSEPIGSPVVRRRPRTSLGAASRVLLPPVACVLLLAGCTSPGGAGGDGGVGPNEGLNHPMVGQRAPDFTVQDMAGPWLPFSSLKDRPLALLFFRPGQPFAPDLARELGRLRDDPAFHGIIFLGFATDSLDRIKEFIKLQGLTLPLMRDSGPAAAAYDIPDIPTVVLIDGGGTVRFRMDGYLGRQFGPRLQATVEALRRLPTITDQGAAGLELDYTAHPAAPIFSARGIDGRPVSLAALRGRVVVLNFFDQECPHCIKDLPLLVPVLREFEPRGVATIGIASRDVSGHMRDFLRTQGIAYPVVIDADRSIFNQYGSSRTPDTLIIDRDGFIRFREHGDRPDRAAITRLQLRLLLGEEPAALARDLPAGRYLGDAQCRVCHEREYDDWLLTPHSIAWDSLEKGEKWRDPECVACHVTGRGRPGGFVDPEGTLHLANVQCEVCHGMGGGHPGRSAAPVADAASMKKTCAGCHTGKFVLNFDPDVALTLVAHRDHPDLDRLFKYSGEQRQRLETINTRRLEKFKSGVAYVGSDACRPCHAAEFEQWSRTPHAGAFAALLQKRRGEDPVCTPCHTTGLGHKGGFLDAAAPKGSPMTNVQCEVCHGPGDDHVRAPAALKKATVYGITDQCSFCIIQGVCATCHDAKNDPRFDIEKALPKVRHRPAPPPPAAGGHAR